MPMTAKAPNVSAPVPTGAPTQTWLETMSSGAATGYVVIVTPEIATVWMRQNIIGDDRNRRFRKAHARSLALEMKKGQWRLTHQGIAFGASGRLLDGQHRLQAIIDSGVTIPMVVFIDVPEDVFTNFDRGAARNIGDVLDVNPVIAAMAQTLVRLCVRGGGANDARRAMPFEVQRVLEMFKDSVTAQHQASPAFKRGRTLAPIRAAWVVRHHAATDAGKRILEQQWRALAEFDPKRMDESTAAGERRLASLAGVRGGSVEQEAACIGWMMFDPSRRDLDRIRIPHTSTAMNEFRAVVRSILPDLTPDAGGAEVAVVEKPLRPEQWRPMSDPVLGPQLRAKAVAALAAKREQRAAKEG